MNRSFFRVKAACYMTNITMSVVGNLPALLFLTFRELYGISYSLLGLLVVINFATQLLIDLIFSFFSHKFNIAAAVKLTPVISVAGLALYAAAPILFPDSVYFGLVLGTVVFSAASGFSEVLISPTIAAIPCENPEREMSKLHSIYAWGVVFVITSATLLLLWLGGGAWQLIVLLFSIVPILAAVLFFRSELPKMQTPERVSGVISMLKERGVWLCVLAIFLGGAAECTMAQWSSSYLEAGLGIPKVWGDIFGVALFGMMLGLGRSLYAKYGKNVEAVLLLSAIGATFCYLVCALSTSAIAGLLGCALCGFAVAMLWPGCLVAASERYPSGGVFIYAMMAAGGDAGAAIGPQLVGLITDLAEGSQTIKNAASAIGITVEQVGMKLGMLTGMLFPLLGIFVYAFLLKTKNKDTVLSKR